MTDDKMSIELALRCETAMRLCAISLKTRRRAMKAVRERNRACERGENTDGREQARDLDKTARMNINIRKSLATIERLFKEDRDACSISDATELKMRDSVRIVRSGAMEVQDGVVPSKIFGAESTGGH